MTTFSETRRIGRYNLEPILPIFQIDQMTAIGSVDQYRVFTTPNQSGQGDWFVLFHGEQPAFANLFIEKTLFEQPYLESKISYCYPNYLGRNLMSRMFWFIVHEQKRAIVCDELISRAAFAAIDKMHKTQQFSLQWKSADQTVAYQSTTVDDFLEDPITHENKWWLIVRQYTDNIFEGYYKNIMPDFDYRQHITIFDEPSGIAPLTDLELSRGLFSSGEFSINKR